MVGFYCPQARLIVEVDGECHAEDARRTARLASRGYRVIRFQATEILVDLDGVLERLLIEIPPPALAGHLPREGGGACNGIALPAAGRPVGPARV